MADAHVLPDGLAVTIRPLLPSDREELAAGFETLSKESRRRRFFTPDLVLDDRDLDYLTELDQKDHVALAALVHDGAPRGVAVGRYVRLPDDPCTAEVAVTVLDEFQGRGIGTMLLQALADVAVGSGIQRFVTYVLWESDTLLDVLVAAGGRVVPAEPGVARVELDLVGR